MAKRKMLGNIKFIGELGKLEILSENILHLCIKELLVRRKGEDPSEDLECLCQIMRTCGRILDTDKGKLTFRIHCWKKNTAILIYNIFFFFAGYIF